MGKPLSFIPSIDRDGKRIVKLNKEDLQSQANYWKTSLIGYIIGENPYEKAMDNFITNVRNFVTKPQILIHSEG